MAELKEALAYILKHYPANMRHELSNARVTKMLYLADWHQAINYSRQITGIAWYFDNYGPYVDDVKRCADANKSLFHVSDTTNMYGAPKIMLYLEDENYNPQISSDEKASLDHVINQTRQMYWDGFIKLVYSTYPITSTNRYNFLNLVQKANEYRAQAA